MKLYLVGRSDVPAGSRAAMFAHVRHAWAVEHPEQQAGWEAARAPLVLLEVAGLFLLLEAVLWCEAAPTRWFDRWRDDQPDELCAIAFSGERLDRRFRDLPLAFSKPA